MFPDYVYENPLEYLINTQEEKVKYEAYRIKSQLESVNKRLFLIKDEGKVNLMLLCGIIIIYGVSFLVLNGPFVLLRLIASIPYVICLFALVFLTPVLIYKILNGFLQYRLNLYSDGYTRMMKRIGIQTYESERRDCVRLLTKYETYLKRLEEWKEAIYEGTLSLSEEDLVAEFEKMELSGDVPVTNAYSGKMGTFTKVMTAIMWIIPFVVVINAII